VPKATFCGREDDALRLRQIAASPSTSSAVAEVSESPPCSVDDKALPPEKRKPSYTYNDGRVGSNEEKENTMMTMKTAKKSWKKKKAEIILQSNDASMTKKRIDNEGSSSFSN